MPGALLCIAHDPGARLHDIAAKLDVTERSAPGIIADLVDDGYVVKDRDGRRNRYRIQEERPLQEPISAQRTVGEMLDLLVGPDDHREGISQSCPLLGLTHVCGTRLARPALRIGVLLIVRPSRDPWSSAPAAVVRRHYQAGALVRRLTYVRNRSGS